MDLTQRPHIRGMARVPFDSFYHRHTPRWHFRSALLPAFGGAILFGCLVLSSALAIMA
ncbi:MAG: hypothetical protein JJE34_05325 [Alphaproteobacteria bacterium]|nr:hypothetical protein [Alphaproteobacteria bacterium]